MKKLAVICLLVSLAFPSGAVPAFAQTSKNEVVAVQKSVSAENQASQQTETQLQTKEADGETPLQTETTDTDAQPRTEATDTDAQLQTEATDTDGQSQTVDDVTTDVSEYQYPADWDPEDPQNARAYEQLMSMKNAQDEADASVLYGVSTQAAAVTTTWGGKTYTHNDFNTEDCDVVPCIDVSYHQGTIDWKKVKKAGIDYVILRVGYRASASGTLNNDKMFTTYIKGAQQAGLKVGVYIYSQAISVKEAEEEADFVLKRIKGYQIDLPVTFDYEYYGAEEGRLYNAHLSKSEKTKCADAFCKKVKAAGYQTMIYANASFCESELDTAALRKNYLIWMARYNSYSYKESKDKGVRYGGQIDFWQCSESAKVDGIDSTSVDFNWWYKSKNSHAGNGVVYDSDLGTWVYQTDGKIDSDYTGLATNENGTWWIRNGIVAFDYNGLVTSGKDRLYINGGRVNYDYTGLVSDSSGWWYVKAGKVDTGYTDFVQYDGRWWYVENGSLSFDTRGLFWGTVDGMTAWWSVGAGQLDRSETITHNEYGWWYTKNGTVDFNYTGLANNENGWWYVKDGKVDFSYYGFAQNSYGWWYAEAGKVSMDKDTIVPGRVKGTNGWWRIKGSQVVFDTTIAHNENGWWYVEGGQVRFDKDSIIAGKVKGKDGWWHVKGSQVVFDTTIAHNENGWWYVKDGKVDFAYNGYASNENGWWYVEGGQVRFDKDSIIVGTVKGKDGWWHVKESKVVYDTTVDCNENGWWYVKDGIVDFGYNGLAANAMGYWYIKNGRVDFSYTGIAKNENGQWYVKDGKIDFSYSGTIVSGQTSYRVKEGKVESQNPKK